MRACPRPLLHAARRAPLGLRASSDSSAAQPATSQPPRRASEEEYNRAMQAYSHAPYEYKHEAGLYFHTIVDRVIVGTQPRSPGDVDRLRDDEGVTCIMNTQQDKDIAHWGVDFAAVQRQSDARGVLLVRYPFPDFSGEGLRAGLPAAVCALDELLSAGHTVYLHCTAGMGRSPGVAIAYLYWLCGHTTLDDAYSALTSIRPCGPNKEAIRLATCDVLQHSGPPGTLPPPPAAGSSWALERGASLSAEERKRLSDVLLAVRYGTPPPR